MPDQSSYIGMLLRKIVRRFVHIYYPAIHVSHPERLPREGATLYIGARGADVPLQITGGK